LPILMLSSPDQGSNTHEHANAVAMIRTTQNTEHYVRGNNCDGWHLVKTDSLSVIQERMPPGASEQPHVHLQAQQLFYVLAGLATFEVEGQIFAVKANESIHIPRGATHYIANKSDQDLDFLVISEPKAQGDRYLV
ncbi:MAG: cupin domain-containing protein, partial [Hymenobacteraceae bacterium]|nr:cupin domain-containing protein [Hymenobacteraceae bacterium]